MTAVAFDQVDIFAMGQYASSPGDFAKEFADAAALAAERAANPSKAPALTFPTKTLQHFAYWHGESRVENVLSHQVVITKPAEIEILDTAKKTYRRITTREVLTVLKAGSLPLTSSRSKQPGKVDLTLGIDASATDSVSVAGAAAKGYTVVFTAKAENATGSCIRFFARLVDVRGTITSDVLDRPEPAAQANPGAQPNPLAVLFMPLNFSGLPFTPENLRRLPFFDPAGCALNALTLRMKDVPNLLAFGEFYLYRRVEFLPAANGGVASRPTIVSERGNVRGLTDADAVLFEVPGDYTLVE